MKLKATNTRYNEVVDKHKRKIFKVEDMVIIYLLKERFFIDIYNKLKLKKYNPFNVLKKINNNA